MRLKILFPLILSFVLPGCSSPQQQTLSTSVERFEREGSSILKGVKVPAGADMYFASGIVANPKDASLPNGDPNRFGDTYEQSVSALKRIEAYLGEEGLSLKDVVAMKVYVAPDPQNDHKPDFDGWFKAYAEFFNNESNPNKVARSTIGVYTLVNPDMLIEIEVRAVYH
ncbi:RidA family protein [Roseivirga thermotolerans]|uniref:RidA family protein n=1 Tax=Roseivirga thermotolerans TaxID=1758176 RepID=UPI00273EB5A7|nr:RidA family protein [Roseivirga thermotolerans]